MSNQSLRQASVRAVTGTTYDYNGDWSALFDDAGLADGDWNGRLIGWINQQIGSDYADVNGAMQAFAEHEGVFDWDSLGTFTATEADFIVLETGAPNTILLEAGTYSIILE